jgi:ornithine cyclodeaminase/alanine dehydrogenase
MENLPGTLLLGRKDVAALLTLEECIAAVEAAFRQRGLGNTQPPKVLGMPSIDGGFHIKAAMLNCYFAAKLNGNFFHNQQRFAMQNIQGLILLCDAANGYPLAVMDSIEITIVRTGAATAVAAKHLARPESKVVTVCGCGNQGRIQLLALREVLPIEHVYAFDLDETQAGKFAAEVSKELRAEVCTQEHLESAIRNSDVCVTCTPAKQYFVHNEYVSPGTFIAAVGADNEEKQELDPQLLASNTVVADVLEQCVEIGDLHHAVAQGLVRRGEVHGELGEVVAGKKPGRTSAKEITIFDSTGTALQDVAAAALVYERALEQKCGIQFCFSNT